MPKTPEQAAQAMIDNLKKTTGKSLKEWFAVLKKTSFEKHGEFMKHLKGELGLTHGYANLIAIKYREQLAGGPDDDPVGSQYAGDKAQLRPVYDKIVGIVESFGDDVDVSPKKTYVSLRRRKQFALVQPSTKDRVDLGINLKGKKPDGRLEASGSFNAMVSHRVRLGGIKDVDAEVTRWLRAAYDEAG
jgi:Domain of unknown function (DUF5655)/Domain of unknown function (DUF4287)